MCATLIEEVDEEQEELRLKSFNSLDFMNSLSSVCRSQEMTITSIILNPIL